MYTLYLYFIYFTIKNTLKVQPCIATFVKFKLNIKIVMAH